MLFSRPELKSTKLNRAENVQIQMRVQVGVHQDAHHSQRRFPLRAATQLTKQLVFYCLQNTMRSLSSAASSWAVLCPCALHFTSLDSRSAASALVLHMNHNKNESYTQEHAAPSTQLPSDSQSTAISNKWNKFHHTNLMETENFSLFSGVFLGVHERNRPR